MSTMSLGLKSKSLGSKKLKRTRDNKAREGTPCRPLKAPLGQKKNVMPSMVACCKAYATVGEMANVFRARFRRTQGTEYFLY